MAHDRRDYGPPTDMNDYQLDYNLLLSDPDAYIYNLGMNNLWSRRYHGNRDFAIDMGPAQAAFEQYLTGPSPYEMMNPAMTTGLGNQMAMTSAPQGPDMMALQQILNPMGGPQGMNPMTTQAKMSPMMAQGMGMHPTTMPQMADGGGGGMAPTGDIIGMEGMNYPGYGSIVGGGTPPGMDLLNSAWAPPPGWVQPHRQSGGSGGHHHHGHRPAKRRRH